MVRTTRTRAGLAALVPFVYAAPVGAQTARDYSEQTERLEVREVRVLGTRALRKSEVEGALATQASGCQSLLLRPFCAFTRSPAVYQRRYFDQTEFQRDVVRLLVYYYKRGWRDAQVDTAVTRRGPGGVAVTFTVREGPVTRTTAVTVDDPANTLRPREVDRLVAPDPGQPFNTLRLDTAVTRVRDAFFERGYGNAVVGPAVLAVDKAADTAGARIPVRRGPLTPIGRIDIVHLGAEPRVADATIRNALTVRPGDLFRRTEVGRSQRRLYESGLFRSALIDTAVATQAGNGQTVCASQAGGAAVGAAAAARPASAAAAAQPDSVKNLVVCVLEAPLREARTSVGFTTADFLQVEGRFTHNYFFGGSRRLNVQATVGNLASRALFQALPQNVFANPFRTVTGGAEGQFFLPTYYVGVDVQQRDVGSPRNTFGFGLFASRRQSPGVFVDQGQGANATYTRRIGDRSSASLGYRFELNRVAAGDVYFCVNFGICDGPTIAAVSTARRLSPLTLSATVGRVDNPLGPRRGLVARFDAEHASNYTFSQFRYNRAFAQASAYQTPPFLRGVTLAARVRAGFVGAIGAQAAARGLAGEQVELLHPRTRFYAGGAQSVRGYGENQLGPRVLTIAPNRIQRFDSAGRTFTVPFDGCAGATREDLLTCFANRARIRRFELVGGTDSSLAYPIDDANFTPRPLGGTVLVETNLEARFPIVGPLVGAVFVDAGVLGEGTLRDVSAGTRTVTPGFGFRYRSPVGPVRIDLGIRPTLVERLPVITQTTTADGRNELADLTSDQGCSGVGAVGCREYPQQNTTGLTGIVRRLVLHLSIGEAF